MQKKPLFFFWFIIAVMLFNGPISHVHAKAKNIYWGGVGFSGAWSQRAELYPQASKLLCLARRPCPEQNLDVAARRFFAKKNFSKFKFTLSRIPPNVAEALVGVISISGESLGITKDIEKEEKSYLHVYRIFSNFLIYEVGSGKIIQSIPITIRFSTYLKTQASDKKSYEIVKNLLTSDGLGLNLFDVAYNIAKDIDPVFIPGKYVQISSFRFSEEASKAFQVKKIQALQAKFAQFFEGELVARTKAHMIPSAGGASVVSGRLKATFADGERTLVIPEAAVKVRVLVRMAKLYEKVNGPQKTVCHFVALTFKASDEIEEISQLKFAIVKDSCGVTSVKQTFEPKFYFSRSLFSLLQNMAKQFGASKPDQKWLDKNARGNTNKDVAIEIIKVRKNAFSLEF